MDLFLVKKAVLSFGSEKTLFSSVLKVCQILQEKVEGITLSESKPFRMNPLIGDILRF